MKSGSTILALTLLIGMSACGGKDVEVTSHYVGASSEKVAVVDLGPNGVDIAHLKWPECRRITNVLVQDFKTMSPPVSVTIYYNDNDCTDSQAHVKASCQWSERHVYAFDEYWTCVSPDGHVDGTVYKPKSQTEWSSFKGSAYCDDGGGFITRQAAMACIQKEGITK